MILSMLAAATAVVSAQAPSAAVQALVNQDLRCLAVFSSLADDKDKENEAGMTGAIMYYVGRIDARVPNFQFGPALEALFADGAWSDSDFAADAQRCGTEMGQRGEELSAIGNAMSEAKPGK